jgi:protein-disulfide isomerase
VGSPAGRPAVNWGGRRPSEPPTFRRISTEEQLRSFADSVIGWRGAPWIGGTLVLLLGALAVFFFTENGSASEAAYASSPSQVFVGAAEARASDISYGAPNPESVIIEYSDFECGACARLSPELADLRERYGDRVRFVFRFFPLNNHRYGLISAQAAYAASLQDMFWEMHDLLYERQTEWVRSDDPTMYFYRYAAALGLDGERFRTDLYSPDTTEYILGQQAEGYRWGVNRTPYFVLDGLVVAPEDHRRLSELVETHLE